MAEKFAASQWPSQVWTGLKFLRKVAVTEGLLPVTYDRRDGFQLSANSEVWIAFERAL
ncbi:hypothetical protein [Streptomyces sp. NPDC002853]